MFKKIKERFSKRKKLAKNHPEVLRYEELEQRVLFSADVVPGLDIAAVEEQVIVQDVGSDAPVERKAASETVEQTAEEKCSELVFVNENVADHEQLIADLQGSDNNRVIEVVVLESNRDGIEQVSEILSERSGLAAVHVISHGSDGQISLGDSWLNATTLQQNRDAVAGWGNALTETADILFYGSNIAVDSGGQGLLDDIAQLTGADVAASDDLTGSAEKGGDWELEHKTGAIEAQVAISNQVMDNYRAVLESASTSEAAYLSTPLTFEQNNGQTDQQVDFVARGSGYTVFLTEGDAVLTLQEGDGGHVVRLDLLGGDTSAPVSGAELLSSQSNYLIGNDESGWQTDVGNYGAVEYANVYDGIDLHYYGNQRQLEYDFIVSAGADTSQIRLNFEGIQSAGIGENGDLILTLNEQGDQISFKAPVSYQFAEDGSREAVQSRYVLHGDGSIGFELGAYDAGRTLIIDPVLNYSTYLGGLGTEYASGITVDGNGDIFVVGSTYAANFPATIGTFSGGSDVYIAKLTPNGSGATDLVFATYIGGTGNDFANGGIHVDGAGNIIFAGATESGDFATTAGAYDTQLDGPTDAYIAKLDPTGTTLLYSTYFGGTNGPDGSAGRESVGAMAVDTAGNVYITGQTLSDDLPLQGAYDSSLSANSDIYVAKFSLGGNGAADLLYSTYLGGGADYESSSAIAVDSTGKIYIAGNTASADHPTTAGAYQETHALGASSDAYLSILDPSLGTSGLVYSTFLGGTGYDGIKDIYVDPATGIVYAVGYTASTSASLAATAGAYKTENAGNDDAFVVVLNPAGAGSADLQYLTYFGGAGNDRGEAITVDGNGKIYVSGYAAAGLPQLNPVQAGFGGGTRDAFVAGFNPAGAGADDLEFSSYLGGADTEYTSGITTDGDGNIYLAGHTQSNDFPTTTGAYDESYNGDGSDNDAFVVKLKSATGATAIWRNGASTTPEQNSWNGSVFGIAGDTVNVGDFREMAGAEAPTRDEIIVLGVTEGSDISGMIWNGSSWTALPFNNLVDDLSDSFSRRFVVAYERISGDALIVWHNGSSGTTPLSYRIWDGVEWSDEATIATPSGGDPKNMTLVSSPGSDELVLTAGNTTNGHYAMVWDGTAWGNGQVMGTGLDDDIYVEYEQQSGEALVVYGKGDTNVYYRTWNGSVWNGEGSIAKPGDAAGNVRRLTLGADPDSDRIAMGVVTYSDDNWLNVWNGSAWETSQTATTSGTGQVHDGIAVAFERGTGNGLAAYGVSGSSVIRYRTWSSGGGWTNELSGPDIGGVPNTIILDSDPNSENIMLSAQDAGSDVNYVLWDGTAWGTPSEQETDTTEIKNQPFLFLWDQDGPLNDVNEGPTNTMPGIQGTEPDTTLVFSTANGNAISVSDPDAGGNPLEITLTATNGTLTLAATAGLTFTTGDGTTDTGMTFSGSISDINTALDGLMFDPTPAYTGTASLQIVTNDQGNTGAGGAQSDTDAVTIEVGAVNDAPVNTVPGSQTLDKNGLLLFSTSKGTAISVSDVDAGGNAVKVTLTATNGTLTMAGTAGLAFTTGDGNDDSTMIFTGTIANINTALDGMFFLATPGSTGAASVQITTDDQGNSGAGGSLSDTDTVNITVGPVHESLWLSTIDSATAGAASWNAGDLVEFGNPGLVFEPGTTAGTFTATGFSLDSFAGRAADISTIHVVRTGITIGTNSVQLYAGDLLLASASGETLTNSDSSTTVVATKDVFVFRPDTPGDYSSGTFFVLITGADIGLGNVTGVTLVEETTVVGVGAGSTTLQAGEFLLAHDGTTKKIEQFTAGTLAGPTTGTRTLLVDGGDIDIGANIHGLELIETATTIGGVTLQPGQILISLAGDDSAVGNNAITTTRQDVFLLDITQTGADTVGDATLLLQGNDTGLDAGNNAESVNALALRPNLAPVFDDATLSIDENSANETSVGTVTGSDPDGDPLNYIILGGNSGGAFAINASTGEITVANSGALDFEATPVFALTVAAIDDSGAYTSATVTINLDNVDEPGVNDAPANTVPGAQTIDKNGMLLFSSATTTAISISDFDAGGNSVQITLTVDSGTLNLPSTFGLTFSTGDGSDDPTMTFTGTLTDINVALEGMTYVAPPGFTGTAVVEIITNDLGNTGTGGAQSDTDSVSITVSPSYQSLLLTTAAGAASNPGSGSVSWNAGDMVELGDPGLTLEPVNGTTSGTFSSLPLFSLDSFAGRTTNLNGVHYVTGDMTVGTNSLQLQAGDVLFVTDSNENLTNADLSTLAVTTKDIVAFRSTTPGDYSAGDFFIVVRGNDVGLNNITGFSLVEQNTTVGVGAGSTVLGAGDFMIAHTDARKMIEHFTPGVLGGAATNTGALSLLVDGADIGIGQDIFGLELIESNTTLGGTTLQSGQILVTLKGDATVGDNSIDTTRQDIFILDITQTGATTIGDATLLFEGNDVGLDVGNNDEDVWGIGMAPNQAPTVNNASFDLDENSANGTVVGTVSGNDPEGGSLKYAITAGNTDGAFVIDAATGQITVANSAALDYETTPTFNLTVAAIDAEGAFDTATITANLNDVNEAPVLDNSGDMALTIITEDQTTNAGNTVAEIIASAGGDRITDPDVGALEGIAVTGLNSGNGTWQYSINGGGSWLDVGSVSDSSGLLLRDTDKLRFVPDAQNADAASITFRAWDQGSGTAGTKVDVSVNGGMTAFSAATEFAAITVTAVNDAPSGAGASLFSSINEDDFNSTGKLVSAFTTTTSDPDSGALKGIAIIEADNTNGEWQYTLDGTNWFAVGTVSETSARLLAADATTRVRFVPDADYNGTVYPFKMVAWDQTTGTSGGLADASVRGGTTAFSSPSTSVSIGVDAVNDAPTATANTVSLASVSEDTADPAGATVSSLFGPVFSDATDEVAGGSTADAFAGVAVVANTANAGSEGVWQWHNGTSWVDISTSVSTSSALVLESDTLVRFLPNADYNGTPGTLTARLIDDSDGAVTAGSTIDVATSGGTTAYSDGSNAVTLDTSITPVNDAPVGLPVITGTVTEDQVLAVDTSGISDVDGLGAFSYQWKRDGSNIVGATASTYTLGDDDVAANISVEVSYTDGDGALETLTSAAVGPVVNVNDAPIVTVDPTPVLFLTDPIDIDPTLTVTDVDSATLESAQVYFGNGFQKGHDRLEFTDQLGITGSFDNNSGILSLTGTASVADYQTALQSVQYRDANPTPAEGILYVHITVLDGIDTSNIATRVIEVVSNLPPRVGDDAATLNEGSSEVIDLAANDTDAEDKLDLISIVITSGPANGSVIVHDDGTVTYTHDGSETTTDTFEYTIKDLDGYTSSPAPVTITVIPVNDDPVIDTVNLNVAENETNAGTVTATDVDVPADTFNWSITGSGADDGLFSINSSTGELTFNAAPDFETPGDSNADNVYEVQVQVNDGTVSVVKNITVTVTNVNEYSVSTISDIDAAGDNVLENSAVGTAVGVTANTVDLDGGDTVTYSLDDDAGGLFTIDASTGVVTVAGALDAENAASHSITIRATSSDTSFSTTTLAIAVNDINEFSPVANDATVAVDENAANGTSVHTVVATDADATASLSYSITAGNDDGVFTINSSTGEITVADNSSLDREATASYGLTVQVSDGTNTDTALTTVNVGDVNESAIGPVTDSDGTANTVAENASIGDTVGITALATDADGTDTVTYSLSDDAGGLFTIDTNTGVVTVANALDYETATSHSVTVLATSSDTSTSSQVFTINVTDINESAIGPVSDNDVTANTVAENASIGDTVGITALATDADGTDTVTYSLSDDAGGLFTIDTNTGVVTVANALDYETATSHSVTVLATSSDTSTTSQAFTINVTDINESAIGPVTDSDGTANTVAENASIGDTVGITALATDADGTDTVTYSLSDDAGGLFTIDTNTGVVTVANALDYETATSHSVTVLATSSDTSTTSQAFTINVTDINESAVGPVTDNDVTANTVAENASIGDTVGITALATDPDGTDTVTYSLSDDAGGLFTIDTNTGVVTVANALDYETATSHSITVLATSSDTSTSSQVFTINVTDINESAIGPVSDNDVTANTVAENASIGDTVGITALATDADGTDTVTYSLSDDAGGLFTIDTNTGVVTVANALDYETATSHSITVLATSSDTSTSSQVFTINVTDINESAVGPVTDNDGTTNTVAENASIGDTVGITALATDADGTDTVTYSLSDDAGGLFTIDTNTGVVTVANALDYETATSHSITVLATSSDASTSSQAFTINVTDINESAIGPVTDSDGTANTVAENASIGDTVGITALATDADGTDTVTYSLSDDAGGLFTIDTNTGVVTVANALDYETATSHSVTVLATSSDTSTSSQVFTINVTDINESAIGPVTDSDGTANTVAENASIGDTVGITALATDADGTDTVTYSLSDDAGGLFTIDTNTGVVTVANALDYETATSHSVTVLATSSDTSTSSQAFTINVTDINESAIGPVTDSDGTANTVAENASIGDTVGITALATDADGTDTVTYSLSDDAGGLFTIDTNTGVVTVANALDYETATSHSITALATSSDTSTTSQAFTINVTDINESAVGPVTDNDGTANTVAENASIGDTVGITALATDADGTDTVTYSLSDDAGGLFTIDTNTGVVTVANALDYETATSHSITVLATSSDTSTSSQVFTINVTDVNESAIGPVTDSDGTANTVAENASIGDTVGIAALATDPDGTDTVTYSLSDDVGGLFTIDTNTGVVTVANALDYETATSHTVTVLATSSDGSTSSAAFTITVTNVNETPSTLDDSASGDEDTVITGNVLANDIDGDIDNLTATMITGPTHGTATLNADGTFSYTPDADWSGNDSFTYTANDGALDSNIATVTITVNPVDDTDPDNGGTSTIPKSILKDPNTDEDEDSDVESPTYEAPGEDSLAEDEPLLLVEEYQAPEDSADADESIVVMKDPQDEETQEIIYLTDEIDRDTQPEGRDDDRGYTYYDNDLYKDMSSLKYWNLIDYAAQSEPVAVNLDDISFLDFESDETDPVVVNEDYDALRQEIDESFNSELKSQGIKAKIVTATAATFTVGIVSYLLRAGSLVASMMSALPLWRGFDPIAIFSGNKKKKKKQDEISDTDELKPEAIFDGDTE